MTANHFREPDGFLTLGITDLGRNTFICRKAFLAFLFGICVSRLKRVFKAARKIGTCFNLARWYILAAKAKESVEVNLQL